MPEPETPAARPAPADQIVTTQHTAVIGGQDIVYTATAGTIVLKEEMEKKADKEGESEGERPRATVFFAAYTRADTPDPAARPITFCFNGGPGSSSAWLHLGALGPRRVLLDAEGNALRPPYRLVDNEHSLLDVTDLVFIDPVSTGFSRPVTGEKAKEFHGFKKDIESVGDFVRLYASRYGRWASPLFLAGESYGTTRAAGLAGYLQERHGMFLSGIMLVSTVLDFGTIMFHPGNDLPYILILPTYAATAWYHGHRSAALPAELPALLQEAETFALGEYAAALLKGRALEQEERKAVTAKLARFTGLSADYIERADLRPEIMRFTKELLRDQRRTVGRLDSRFKGIDRDAVGEDPEHDPSMSNILGPYTATLNDYVRRELGFESDLPYEILNPRVRPWSYAEHENRYVNVAETLRKAMSVNPALRVFVASGCYDLATPYFAADYTVNHLGLDPCLQGNVTLRRYAAGHMMYIHLPSLAGLKADMTAFIEG